MEKDTIGILLDLNTLLLNAIKYGKSIECIKLLLNDGADPNTFSSTKTTPLAYAINQKNIPLIVLLLENGADPNFTASSEVIPPPLIISIYYRNIEITKLLIEYGADINIRDHFGRTALICAAKTNHIKMTTLLFENGANIHISDNGGQTALMHAQTAVTKAQAEANIAQLAVNNKYMDIFYTLITKYCCRKEFLTYLESIRQSQQAPISKMGMFMKISIGPRQYWPMDILRNLGEKNQNLSKDVKECKC